MSMHEISGAIPEDTENNNHDTECSFIVQVQESKDVRSSDMTGADDRNDLSCGSSTPAGTSCDSSYRDGGEKASQFHAKPFYLRASCKAERDQWINDINAAVRTYQSDRANQKNLRTSAFYRQQLRLRSIYTSFAFQAATAFLVALNFFVTVCTHLINIHSTTESYGEWRAVIPVTDGARHRKLSR
jgi:hypothetical protein